MRAPSAFRQRDVTRAIRAARAAGLSPHVWIGKDGAIHIAEATTPDLTAPPAEDLPEDAEAQWDKAF